MLLTFISFQESPDEALLFFLVKKTTDRPQRSQF